MPEPRYRQVSIEDTPYYHCISRCVRRAFLCGKDTQTGFDFGHRRQWIIDRIKLLCSVFAVDMCAYAIMSNHYDVVIRIDAEQAKGWSDEEVAKRGRVRFGCLRSFVSQDLIPDRRDEGTERIVHDLINAELGPFRNCLKPVISKGLTNICLD